MTAAARITYVGHATVLAELDGVRLLTDPVLRARVGPLRRHGAPPAPGDTADLDAVLVSHLHHDHADLPSLRRLGRGVRLVVPAGAGRFFRRRGFRAVEELGPGESTRVGAVTVTATEADHPSESRFERDSRAVGFLLEGERRVYFAGDTDLFEGWRSWAASAAWTWPCCRSGAGVRASAPATSTPSAPPARRRCSPRASPSRSTGARSTRSASPGSGPAPCVPPHKRSPPAPRPSHPQSRSGSCGRESRRDSHASAPNRA